MDDYAQTQVVLQWINANWTRFTNFFETKMTNVTQLDRRNTMDDVTGIVCSYVHGGERKVVLIDPTVVASGLSGLSDDLYNRCIAAATAAENAADYADGRGDYADVKGGYANAQGTFAHTQGTFAQTQGTAAQTQAAKALNLNDHPAYIGANNYWYIWDYTSQQYVQSASATGDVIDYSTLTSEEKQRLINSILSSFVFASRDTCKSIINELT